jgi:hypothetical protein
MAPRCVFNRTYDKTSDCTVRTDNASLVDQKNCETVSNYPYQGNHTECNMPNSSYMLTCNTGYTENKNGASYNTCEKKNI